MFDKQIYLHIYYQHVYNVILACYTFNSNIHFSEYGIMAEYERQLCQDVMKM